MTAITIYKHLEKRSTLICCYNGVNVLIQCFCPLDTKLTNISLSAPYMYKYKLLTSTTTATGYQYTPMGYRMVDAAAAEGCYNKDNEWGRGGVAKFVEMYAKMWLLFLFSVQFV